MQSATLYHWSGMRDPNFYEVSAPKSEPDISLRNDATLSASAWLPQSSQEERNPNNSLSEGIILAGKEPHFVESLKSSYLKAHIEESGVSTVSDGLSNDAGLPITHLNAPNGDEKHDSGLQSQDGPYFTLTPSDEFYLMSQEKAEYYGAACGSLKYEPASAVKIDTLYESKLLDAEAEGEARCDSHEPAFKPNTYSTIRSNFDAARGEATKGVEGPSSVEALPPFRLSLLRMARSMMEAAGEASIMWIHKDASQSFMPIPWCSQHGIWCTWTVHGLCFLLDMSGCPGLALDCPFPEEKDCHLPFAVIGMHSFADNYFQNLKRINPLAVVNSCFNAGNTNLSNTSLFASTQFSATFSLSSSPSSGHSDLSEAAPVDTILSTDNEATEGCTTQVLPRFKSLLSAPTTRSQHPLLLNKDLEPMSRATRGSSGMASGTLRPFQNRRVPCVINMKEAQGLYFYGSVTAREKSVQQEWVNAVVKFNYVTRYSQSSSKSHRIRWSVRKAGKGNRWRPINKLKTKVVKADESCKAVVAPRKPKSSNASNCWKWEEELEEKDMTSFNEEYGLPTALADECAILAGRKKCTSLRCNISLANHRINSALQQSYRCFLDKSEIIQICHSPQCKAKRLSNSVTPTEPESASQDAAISTFEEDAAAQQEHNESFYSNLYAASDLPEEGTMIRISYPNEFPGSLEEDYLPYYGRMTLAKALAKIVEMSEDGSPDLSPMNLGQFAYRLFWCLAILSNGKVERFIEELVPMAASKRFRRKCPWNKEINKSINEKRLRCEAYKQRVQQNKELRQRDLELRFEQMNARLEAEAEVKRQRQHEIQLEFEAKYGKKNRHAPLLDCDEKGIIEAVLDVDAGVFRRPLMTLTELQKRYIYQACIRRNITAAIKLTKSEKGRGVLAAGFIHKDDFVLEYRGELISEREGRERDSKYDRSRTQKGSFMFYFKHNSKNFSIDATDESAALGPARLINHSKRSPNLVAKTISVDDVARLFFCAKRNIFENEELLVDYGERDPEVIQKHPWLNS